MLRRFSGLKIFFGVLLTQSVSAQLGHATRRYIHPQEAWQQLQQVEATLSELNSNWKDVEVDLKTWSNPNLVLQWDVHLGPNISITCSNQVLEMWKAIVDGGSNNNWALAMLDSWGKPEAGLEAFNLAWLGNFEECINSTRSGSLSFSAQYCTVGAPLYSAASAMGISVGFTVGGCFPSGCSEDDIYKMVSAIPSNYTKDVTVQCQETDMPYSNGAIATIVVYCIMGGICLLGTFYDFTFIMSSPTGYSQLAEDGHQKNGDLSTNKTADGAVEANVVKIERRPGAIGEFLMCFSLYTNGYKLLSTKQPPGTLTCLHGIRFISMTWVILGHTLATNFPSIKNVLSIFSWVKRWTFEVLVNATVSVDSFFVISAVLTSYLFLKDLEKRKPGALKFLISVPIMYLHRYIRLTPAYGFMILFYACLSLYLYNGPLKPVHTDITDPYCKTNWWSAILYINNVIEPEKMCAAWGWYLSNDFQFFLVTPFVVYLMYIVPVVGFILGVIMVIASAGAATGIAAVNDFNLGQSGARDPNNTHLANPQAAYMQDYYFAPWARYQSFGVGVLFGFLLWRFHGKIRIPTAVNLCLWAVSAAMMLAVLYGPYDVVSAQRIATAAEAAIYNGWSRTAWSIGLGYVILACCMGHGGWVNEFLSWPGFVPLSRMTYCAYLVHPVIMVITSSSRPTKVMWNDITFIYMFAAYLTLSYAVAFLFSIMFEAPFMLLDKKYITGKLSKSVK